jgi:AcrR family transcriptional regulator
MLINRPVGRFAMAPKVTAEYKESTRNRILAAAQEIFSQRGYASSSMDDIVERSRLSKGALYWYFNSKEELFVALQDKQLSSSVARLKAKSGPEDSAMVKLERAAEIAFASLIGDDKDASRMNMEFNLAAMRMKPVQRRQDARYRTVHSFILGYVEDGIRRGEFRRDLDPDEVATVLVGVIDGLSLRWATTTFDFDRDSIRKTLVEMVLNGLVRGREWTAGSLRKSPEGTGR